MSKYLPLTTFLRRYKGSVVTMTFAEIERVLTRGLPKAAASPEWWAADQDPTQPQQRALADAGFTAWANVRAETVQFVRKPQTVVRVPPPGAAEPVRDNPCGRAAVR